MVTPRLGPGLHGLAARVLGMFLVVPEGKPIKDRSLRLFDAGRWHVNLQGSWLERLSALAA